MRKRSLRQQPAEESADVALGEVRNILFAGGLAGLTLAGDRRATAVDYPTRPVRWIVSYTAGRHDRHPGAPRRPIFVGQARPQFIIENKPGAGNNIGTERWCTPRPMPTPCSW